MQERLESTSRGQAALSLVIGALLVTVLAGVLPASPLQRALAAPVRPITEGLGLVQSWGVFAPDPRPISVAVHAEVELAGAGAGMVVVELPDSGDGPGAYRTYRWRKFQEHLYQDANAHLWGPAATWAAAQVDGVARSVHLVRTWRELGPPGTAPAPLRSYRFFTLDVAASS